MRSSWKQGPLDTFVTLEASVVKEICHVLVNKLIAELKDDGKVG